MAELGLLLFIFCFLSFYSNVLSVLPPYLPALQQGNCNERGEVIECYYNLGMNYREILLVIGLIHGFYLSMRQLKRILKSRGLGRRRNRSNYQEVCRCIEMELRGSGSTIGYRQMTQRLSHTYGLSVDKDTVRNLLKCLDPEGVEARSKHRLSRRQYKTQGPNHLWHIDGYDKLKPFGFCIHGAIDGYSRRIMWLEIGPSNNDPFIVAQYFVDCVRQIGGIPRLIRADCGTENVNIAAIRFFHSDADSFLYGKSCSNQRIEAWWGSLRKGCTGWWMGLFKDLRDLGLFSDEDVIQVECLKFCFMQVLRDELYKFAEEWNLHRIRPSTNEESPSGRPDILYFVPEINGARNLMTPVALDDIEIAENRCCYRPASENGCADEFCELASIIMQEKNLEMPKTADDAIKLYLILTEDIRKLL